MNKVKMTESNSIPTPEIIWKRLSKDDFNGEWFPNLPLPEVFQVGRYDFRVEQMDKRKWWWSVSYDGVFLNLDSSITPSERKAKQLCEACFREHFEKNKC